MPISGIWRIRSLYPVQLVIASTVVLHLRCSKESPSRHPLPIKADLAKPSAQRGGLGRDAPDFRPTGSMTMRPLAHRLVHGTLWPLAARVVGIGGALLGTVLLTRFLSTAEMGIFFLAASVMQVTRRIGQYGLLRVAVRRISESLALQDRTHAARVGRDLTVFGILFILVTSLLMWLFVFPVLPFFIGMMARIAELKDYIVVWAAAMVIIGLSSAVLCGFHDNRAASLVGVALAPVLATVGYLFMFFISTGDNLKTAIVLTAVTHAIAAIVAPALLRKPLRNSIPTHLQGWNEIMSGATPFWINSVPLLLLSSAGLWVLGAYYAESDVAIYGAAMKLIAVSVGMIGIVQPVLQPVISDSYARNDHLQLGRTLRAAGLVTGLPTILVCVTFMVFPGFWMELVFGPVYREGADVLIALSAGYLAAAFIGLPGIALEMTDAQKQFMFATLATGTITLAAILLFTADFGRLWLAVVVFGGPGFSASGLLGDAAAACPGAFGSVCRETQGYEIGH
jgi:O-antigen/teichoic acid export membrane protein